MTEVTQIAFQIDNHNLAELDAAVHRGEFRSRAEALRTATAEFLARQREARIDAQLAAGYAAVPPGPDDETWADASREGLRAADLEW